MFFLLEQKELKIQDKPDPSGRFVGHHTEKQILRTALQTEKKVNNKFRTKFKL